ncbi:hypothetical protein AgCh_028351 [Apium graveolens]
MPRLPNFIPLPSFSLPGGVAFLGWKFIIILSMGWKFIIILSMRNKKLFWVSAAAPLTSGIFSTLIVYIFSVLEKEAEVLDGQLGMARTLETLCGQSYGAKRYDILEEGSIPKEGNK